MPNSNKTATTAEARAWLRENSDLEVGARGFLSAEARTAFKKGTGKTVVAS